jgi:hypothetical protein
VFVPFVLHKHPYLEALLPEIHQSRLEHPPQPLAYNQLGSPITDGDGGFTLAFRVPDSFPPGLAVIQFAPLDPAGGSATVEVTIR